MQIANTFWGRFPLFLHVRSILLAILTFAFLPGCVAHEHYHSYLLEPDPYNVPPAAQQTETYILFPNNAVAVPKGTRVRMKLDEIRVGFVHFDTSTGVRWDSKRGPVAFENEKHNGLGGRDFWLVADIVSLDNKDPLGLKEKRQVAVTNVKIDNESFAFLPIDAAEGIFFDEIADTSFRVRFRLYVVHGVDFKKFIYQTGSSSLGKAAWDAAYGLVTSTFNVVGKEAMDWLKGKSEDPLFFERLLLESGAELVMNGNYDVTLTDTNPPFQAQPFNGIQKYALYDIVKSELDADYNGEIDPDVTAAITAKLKQIKDSNSPPPITLPTNMKEYIDAYLFLHSGQYKLPDANTVKGQIKTGPPNAVQEHLKKAYIKFSVTSGAAGAAPAF